MQLARTVVTLLSFTALLAAQVAEYDFYRDFRSWMRPVRLADRSLTREQIIDRYAAKLRTEGVAAAEVDRRTHLLRTAADQMEDDFWNRFFTQGKSNYNTAPNAFLTEMVENRPPGVALDYGMGAGRNALYLAKRGWQVAGFDPAKEAVALAQQHAKEFGLKIDAATVRDSEYDFGRNRFDLVLFSWTMPAPPIIPKIGRAHV